MAPRFFGGGSVQKILIIGVKKGRQFLLIPVSLKLIDKNDCNRWKSFGAGSRRPKITWTLETSGDFLRALDLWFDFGEDNLSPRGRTLEKFLDLPLKHPPTFALLPLGLFLSWARGGTYGSFPRILLGGPNNEENLPGQILGSLNKRLFPVVSCWQSVLLHHCFPLWKPIH